MGLNLLEGLKGFNLLILKEKDAMVIANLMMGESGNEVEEREQDNGALTFGVKINELQLSAAGEAMNQMIGSAATAMASLFQRRVNVSPPSISVIRQEEPPSLLFLEEGHLVVISFRMIIGEFIDTEIMQVINLEAARKQASLILQNFSSSSGVEKELKKSDLDFAHIDKDAGTNGESPSPSLEVKHDVDQGVSVRAEKSTYTPAQSVGNVSSAEWSLDNRKMNLILDIPLKVTVVLGRARKSIKEVLNLGPGAILELSALVDEPLEVLVNGTLVARGEVVVINENFGVRITSIINAAERFQYLEM